MLYRYEETTVRTISKSDSHELTISLYGHFVAEKHRPKILVMTSDSIKGMETEEDVIVVNTYKNLLELLRTYPDAALYLDRPDEYRLGLCFRTHCVSITRTVFLSNCS